MGLALSHSLDDLDSDDICPGLGGEEGMSLSEPLNPLSVLHKEVGEPGPLEIGEEDRLEQEDWLELGEDRLEHREDRLELGEDCLEHGEEERPSQFSWSHSQGSPSSSTSTCRLKSRSSLKVLSLSKELDGKPVKCQKLRRLLISCASSYEIFLTAVRLDRTSS